MGLKITTTGKDGKEKVYYHNSNVFKGYTVTDNLIYKTKNGPSSALNTETEEDKQTDSFINRFVKFIKGLIKKCP